MSVESVTQLFPRAEQWDTTNYYLAAIVENMGGLKFDSWKTVQGLVRAGLHTRIFSEFSQFTVDRDTAVSIDASTGLTASVDMIAFENAVGTSHTEAYEFIYDGSVWKLHENEVELSNYGITISSGTPTEGASLVVHITASENVYDVIGLDYDEPSDDAFEHSLTICPHNVVNYNILAYKKPQMLFYVDPTTYPDGLAAGTYSITLDHGAYNAATTQDATYKFTTTQVIPAGGGFRHSIIGVYRSDSDYTVTRALTGTFTTFDTIANYRQTIELGLATAEDTDASGTNLGTFTAEDITLRSSAYCNLTRRSGHGSNDYLTSDERCWMNSDAAPGLTNNIPNWFEFQTIFDLPGTANIAGFLYGLDPELKSVLGRVKKRTFVHMADRTDTTVAYVDTDELIFPLSMTEVNLNQNSGVYETPVVDGTPKTTPYDYYVGAGNDKRIKYEGTTARTWWLRSPYPSSALTVRVVNSSGALNSYGAYGTYGPVPGLCIV